MLFGTRDFTRTSELNYCLDKLQSRERRSCSQKRSNQPNLKNKKKNGEKSFPLVCAKAMLSKVAIFQLSCASYPGAGKDTL